MRQYCASLDLITHAYNMWQSRPWLKAFFIPTRFHLRRAHFTVLVIRIRIFWSYRIRFRIRQSLVPQKQDNNCFVTSVPTPHLDPQDPYVFGPPVSGSVSQRCGSEGPDPHTASYKNVTDPQHCQNHTWDFLRPFPPFSICFIQIYVLYTIQKYNSTLRCWVVGR